MTRGVVWLLALLLVPATGRAEQMCVVPARPDLASDPTLDELEALWPRVAAREGLPISLYRAAAPGVCPAGAALELRIAEDALRVRAPDGSAYTVALPEPTAWQRAREIAREAAEVLHARSAALPSFLVDEPPARGPTVRWGATLGGGYALHPAPGRHRGGLDLTFQAALLDEALLVGLRVGWAPPQQLAGASPPATWTEADLGVVLHGTLSFGSFRLRGGAGLAAAYHEVASEASSGPDDVSAREWGLLVLAEVELEWAAWDPVRLAVALGGRFQPTEAAHTGRGDAPAIASVAAGTMLVRVGYWFD